MTYEEARDALQAKMQEASQKTLQQLFDEMVGLGLRSQRNDCTRCLVSDYLSLAVQPDFRVFVGTARARLVLPEDTHGNTLPGKEHFLMPRVLQLLITMFDFGNIPELDLNPSDNQSCELPFAARCLLVHCLRPDEVFA